MGALRDLGRIGFRDHVTLGVPASGPHHVDKEEVRDLAEVAEQEARIWAQPATGKTCYLEDYGVDPAAGDNATAINTVIANATKGDSLLLPPTTSGNPYIKMGSPFSPIPGGVVLSGRRGNIYTCVYRNYSPANPDEVFIPIANDFSATVEAMTIRAKAGTSGGIAVGHIASATTAPQSAKLKDLTIDGEIGSPYGQWRDGVHLNGTGASASPGLRDWFLTNLQIFACARRGLALIACRNINAMAINIVEIAGSPHTDAGLYLNGSAALDGENHLILCNQAGEVRIAYQRSSIVLVAGYTTDVTITTNCVSVTYWGAQRNALPMVLGTGNVAIMGDGVYTSSGFKVGGAPFIPPQMTKAAMLALTASTYTGGLVFLTDQQQFAYSSGSDWRYVNDSSVVS